MAKIRPDDSVPETPVRRAEIWAARNEFESFQVVLRAGTPLSSVDVSISDLRGASDRVIPAAAVAIYREGFVTVQKPSSPEGASGEWPDPLLPRVDRYWHERRNTFPFNLSPGRNQPVWVEVYVPPDTAAGEYRGSLAVSADGSSKAAIPVSVHVWSFSLPSTSTMRTAFGLSGVTALKKHRGQYTSDDDLYGITSLYRKAALMHRISIYGGTMIPPALTRSGAGIEIDWSTYDKEEGPFLDGTIFGAGDPLPGAKATSVDLRTSGAARSREEKISYWRAWSRHFRKKGWSEILYHYLWDEPPAAEDAKIVEAGKLVHEADVQLRNLVTAPYHEPLPRVVDIWAPLINCFESKPGFPDFCAHTVGRDEYAPELKRGKELWWYQSCASHGCNGVQSDYFRGWPSYIVDVAAISNRIMPWLSWKYRVSGELYFSMNESYSGESDPWTSIYAHGGNGDGTFFYPGRPEAIGGTQHVPIESMRLKLIRDGLEDYEYLVLLAKKGLAAEANEYAGRMVRKTYQWEHRADVLYSVRHAIGEMLSRLK